MPPYTTSDVGSSATSASRLFCSIRNGASVSQDLHVNVLPRGARIERDGSTRLDIVGGSCMQAKPRLSHRHRTRPDGTETGLPHASVIIAACHSCSVPACWRCS